MDSKHLCFRLACLNLNLEYSKQWVVTMKLLNEE